MNSTSSIVPRSRRESFVQKHPLILFLALALVISWAFWFIEPVLRKRNSITATFFIQLGTFGPVLAAMLVSFLSTAEKPRPTLRPRLLAGGLALGAALSTQWFVFGNRPGAVAQLGNILLLTLLTLLPAWIFFNTRSRSKGVQELLHSLARWRVNPLWFAVALFLMFTLSASGVLLTSLMTGKPLSAWLDSIRTNPTFLHLAPTFLATALYGGPLGEEAGWRGFALPRLQKRFDPLLASVYLGLIWALWHAPLHLTGYYNALYGNALGGILSRTFTTIPIAVLFTWLYNRTGGNLLVMVVLHTALNITSGLIAPQGGLYVTVTIAVVLMVVIDRMYKKAADDGGHGVPQLAPATAEESPQPRV